MEELDNQARLQETLQIDIRDLTPAIVLLPTTSTAARIPLIQSPTTNNYQSRNIKGFCNIKNGDVLKSARTLV